MDEINRMAARLGATDGLAATLAAGFDAFEAIRAAARDGEDRAPELFAAFMLAAGAAVEGRNALAAAPSLPGGRGETVSPAVVPPDVDAGEIADALAALGGLLTARLREAAGLAPGTGNEAACTNGARAAEQIQRLLQAGDDTHIR
jgi:hypothetical protein